MPWCEECAHYFTPSAMNPDGTCPQCGAKLEDQRPITSRPAKGPADGESDEDTKAPWHFKLMIVLLVLYLIWRLVYWLIL